MLFNVRTDPHQDRDVADEHPEVVAQMRTHLEHWWRGVKDDVLEPQAEAALKDGFLSATACNGTNRLEIMVFGHSEQMLLVARYDNLGKGAAGAAVQNLNLMMGIDETKGLTS